MTQQLEKAVIEVLEGKLARESPLEVLFNPTEYSLELSNNYQEKSLPGLQTPIVSFVNGESQTLTMELLFDTWSNDGGSDVTELTNKFARTLEIDPDLHAPPRVIFSWGSFHFQAIVQSISQRFTMFAANGHPVRATLNVTFKKYRKLSEQIDDPRLLSSDKTKRRVLSADDSLWAMAEREYGDASQWRRIARKSRIANPLAITPGTVVVLPPLDETDGNQQA